jgi:hypothetical protein
MASVMGQFNPLSSNSNTPERSFIEIPSKYFFAPRIFKPVTFSLEKYQKPKSSDPQNWTKSKCRIKKYLF